MSFSAKIIADSVSEKGFRITTMELRYPRFIHSEFMTHRAFSRNASSSRAIPVSKIIQDVLVDPAMPVYWGKNQPGMQAHQELTGIELDLAKAHWLTARDNAVELARKMIDDGAHKQIVNRILEPWAHIKVVVTATEWANFYQLRRHPDAQPEMQTLAEAMWLAYGNSIPITLPVGRWHLPYVWETHLMDHDLIKASVARCARVSYWTHDGKSPDFHADIKLHDRLIGAVPMHASPAEHQALSHEGSKEHQANFRGWLQYRQMLPGAAA